MFKLTGYFKHPLHSAFSRVTLDYEQFPSSSEIHYTESSLGVLQFLLPPFFYSPLSPQLKKKKGKTDTPSSQFLTFSWWFDCCPKLLDEHIQPSQGRSWFTSLFLRGFKIIFPKGLLKPSYYFLAEGGSFPLKNESLDKIILCVSMAPAYAVPRKHINNKVYRSFQWDN